VRPRQTGYPVHNAPGPPRILKIQNKKIETTNQINNIYNYFKVAVWFDRSGVPRNFPALTLEISQNFAQNKSDGSFLVQ